MMMMIESEFVPNNYLCLENKRNGKSGNKLELLYWTGDCVCSILLLMRT